MKLRELLPTSISADLVSMINALKQRVTATENKVTALESAVGDGSGGTSGNTSQHLSSNVVTDYTVTGDLEIEGELYIID